MSERGLEDAVRALRGETGDTPATADATRMRILGTVRARRRRGVLAVRTTAVLLAAAIGGAAWAAATGRLPALSSLSGYLGDGSSTDGDLGTSGPGVSGGPAPAASGMASAESAGDVASAGARADGAPSGTVAAAGAGDGSEEPLRPEHGEGGGARASSSAQAATSGAGTGDASRGAASKGDLAESGASKGGAAKGGTPSAEGDASGAANGGAGAAPSDADAAADALYQRAHALHFQAGSWSAARAAWDAYLAAAPRGRFATFAHYNRALCLLRLGRTAEARSALALFASGAFGGYRRAEAQSLLDALNASSAGSASPAGDPAEAAPAQGTGSEK